MTHFFRACLQHGRWTWMSRETLSPNRCRSTRKSHRFQERMLGMLRPLWKALNRPAWCGAALLGLANLAQGQATLPAVLPPPRVPTPDLPARVLQAPQAIKPANVTQTGAAAPRLEQL